MVRRLLVPAALIGTLALAAIAAPIAQSSVPAPESVLGFAPCADYKLATYETIADYFRKLDAASDRMQILEIGRTAEGRTQILTVISSEENLRNLTKYKQIARMLALNRDENGRPLTDERARQLARDGKAIMWVDFGLHATEVAHAQTAPWMAWKAVTEETDEMREIRDKVIFVLVPNMNPDGGTLVANWYMKHVGKPWEMQLPELYQKYVGHDNNRDWFMFNQPESKNIARQLYEEFFPQIVYNQHQTAPFPARIFVPPFEDPANFNIPPLVMRGINTVGDAITRRLDQEGKVGAVSRVSFDTWWNGGMRTAPYFHNMVGILTETAHATATPADYDPARFPRRFSNGESTLEPSTYYPSPYKGGHWTLRNSCEYMITGSMAVLDIGAKRRQEWLYDIYQMARDAMKEGANEHYVIPAEQWDPNAAVRMVNVLRLGGVEIERATASFAANGKQYGAGSFIIRGAQPFLPYVRDLLNVQVYPDRRLYPDGPPEPPYDVSGWTLNMQMGVAVDKLTSGAVTAQTERVTTAAYAPGTLSGTAKAAYAIDPRTNEAFIAVNRLLKAGDAVYRATAGVTIAGKSWPAGTFLVASGQGTHARVEQAAKALGLRVEALESTPAGEMVRVKAPRVGLYNTWGGNMDEGWTRWVLEQVPVPVHHAARQGHSQRWTAGEVRCDPAARRQLRKHDDGPRRRIHARRIRRRHDAARRDQPAPVRGRRWHPRGAGQRERAAADHHGPADPQQRREPAEQRVLHPRRAPPRERQQHQPGCVGNAGRSGRVLHAQPGIRSGPPPPPIRRSRRSRSAKACGYQHRRHVPRQGCAHERLGDGRAVSAQQGGRHRSQRREGARRAAWRPRPTSRPAARDVQAALQLDLSGSLGEGGDGSATDGSRATLNYEGCNLMSLRHNG